MLSSLFTSWSLYIIWKTCAETVQRLWNGACKALCKTMYKSALFLCFIRTPSCFSVMTNSVLWYGIIKNIWIYCNFPDQGLINTTQAWSFLLCLYTQKNLAFLIINVSLSCFQQRFRILQKCLVVFLSILKYFASLDKFLIHYLLGWQYCDNLSLKRSIPTICFPHREGN